MQATKFMGNCTDCNYRKHHMHLFSSHSFTKTQNENAQNACLMQATQFMGNCNDCNYRKHHMHLFSSLSFTKTQNDCFISQQSWLKPGGHLLITDYCCSRGEHSELFKKYLAERQYHLIDVESYGKVSVFRFSVAKVWFLVSKRTDEQNSRGVAINENLLHMF